MYQPNLPLSGRTYVTAGEEHIALSLRAAEEGMVLLKNNEKTLPLAEGCRIALLGKGSFDYVKGGGGSGDVYPPFMRNLYEGLVQEGAQVFEPLADCYRKNVEDQYASGAVPGMTVEPEVPEDLVKDAAAFTDTAVVVVSRFSGEGWDRADVKYETTDGVEFNPWENETSQAAAVGRIFPDGDFYLSAGEKRMVEAARASFKKVIVVLNTGGIVDTSWIRNDDRIGACLLAWQAGMEGGTAAARLLLGKANPCGKLPDTFAERLEDYPSTRGFFDSFWHVDYTEDIYVGYRYFETIPGARDKVIYPFGYGLSYTDFALEITGEEKTEEGFCFAVRVTNTGSCAGKEVVQVYFEAPQGVLGKPARQLGAFAKTKLLAPGESETLELRILEYQMASYDDLGKIRKSAYILEKGAYHFFIGNSAENTAESSFVWELPEDRIKEQLESHLSPEGLPERMLADGTYEALPVRPDSDLDESAIGRLSSEEEEGIMPEVHGQSRVSLWSLKDAKSFIAVAEGKQTLDEFVSQLPDEVLIRLLGGCPNKGVANTWGFGGIPELGIPSFMTADGPAGVRIQPETGVRTTAWPCATLLASTWNTELMERVGKAAGEELKENNLQIWLAPAINIHRSPYCGRNFEYLSEDPYLAGKMAAAEVRGIQENGVACSLKHFACNNKETNRKQCNSRVSERALREIYLKAFEIVVKEADPWTIMSSYNAVNGQRASESRELLTDILRGEWGFSGLVTTDWWNRGEQYKEILAGGDVKMATGFEERVQEALERGLITREDLERNAKHILGVFLRLD